MSAPLILVVDDEEQVGLFATLFLQRAGYRTVRTSSATEALEVFSDEIDLLLTDWAMPDLSGDELAAQLLERNPSLPVIFMSGNSMTAIRSTVPLEAGVNFIPKPFGREDLVSAVSNALSRHVPQESAAGV
jgi:two-component system, cell cycle sensor histidine kinase and response regulator CckA